MDTTALFYPHPAYSFALTIVPTFEMSGVIGLPSDAAFREVQGVESYVTVEEIAEGGVNSHVHQAPGVTKHGNLVLKRGFVALPSGFGLWVSQTIGSTLGTPIVRQSLILSLLSSIGVPIAAWTFRDAWPVKWDVGNFDALSNQVLTETLEIAYSTVRRMPDLSSI